MFKRASFLSGNSTIEEKTGLPNGTLLHKLDVAISLTGITDFVIS